METRMINVTSASEKFFPNRRPGAVLYRQKESQANYRLNSRFFTKFILFNPSRLTAINQN